MEPKNDRIIPKATNGYVPRTISSFKTRIQWFNNLPEETRQKAITNYQNNGRGEYWEQQFPTMEECLKCSFNLTNSPEGIKFWNEVVEDSKSIR